MKHLLNNMSEEEKNAIREQHTGGMKVVTDKFKKLLETKSGDVKPLVSEQSWTDKLDDLAPDFMNNMPKSKSGAVNPIKKQPTTNAPKPTAKTTKPTPPSFSYKNKTVNLYDDERNSKLSQRVTLISEPRVLSSGILEIDTNRNFKLAFNCKTPKVFFMDTYMRSQAVYNTNLGNSLVKNYCTKSSSGANVPKADFASVDNSSDENFA